MAETTTLEPVLSSLHITTDPRFLSPTPSSGHSRADRGFSSSPSPTFDESFSPSSDEHSRVPSPALPSVGTGFGDHLRGQVFGADDLRVREVIARITQQEDAESCFYVADLRVLSTQLARWHRLLPRVEPFYAVKCNSEPRVLSTLAQLGIAGFDCASRSEVDAVLSMGVSPARIIFANPCKQLAHITHARAQGVSMMTFDNAVELDKVARLHPAARLVLRIATDDSRSVCRFSQKFGAHIEQVASLLEAAKRLKLNVIGISFHVGSGCYDATAFVEALRLARRAFDIGASLGFSFSLLDVGGGFPGAAEPSTDPHAITFSAVAALMAPELDRLFPRESVRVIAEPGRFFVTAAFTLATSIHSIRSVFTPAKPVSASPVKGTSTAEDPFAALASLNHSAGDVPKPALTNTAPAKQPEVVLTEKAASTSEESYMYYINDGIYGAFNCIFFDHAHVHPRVVTRGRRLVLGDEHEAHVAMFPSAVFGPTCDGIDCVLKNEPLPRLSVGDWLLFEDFGAYTCVAASNFNGMAKARIEYIELDV